MPLNLMSHMRLIAKILMRVVLEGLTMPYFQRLKWQLAGSTVVMKAINLNDEAALRRAIAVAPRSHRAQELLNITAREPMAVMCSSHLLHICIISL